MPVPPALQPLDGTSGTAIGPIRARILGCVGRASSAFFSILLRRAPAVGHGVAMDHPARNVSIS